VSDLDVSKLEAARASAEKEQAASRTRSRFLGLLSHELRTPLAALELLIERLRRDRETALTAKQGEIVSRMLVSSGKLGALIEILLDYSRFESDRTALSRSRVALGPLVAEVVGDHRAEAERKGIALTLRSATDLPPALVDEHLVRLLVSNLVRNAVRFTPEGSVEVDVSLRDGEHRVSVKDTGPGIAERDRERVFQPFDQVEPLEQKQIPGVGLGLSLVLEIASALGGRVELASAPGVGSTFTVTLPPGENRA